MSLEEEEAEEQQQQPTNTHTPPYSTNLTQQQRQRTSCLVCQHHEPPTQKTLGPYLLQYPHRVYWITLCTCNRMIHTCCLSTLVQQKNNNGDKSHTLLICPWCHYRYHTGWRLRWVRVMEICVHLSSLASVIGLVYGLLFLGGILDQLGLGKDLGTKLDGDETWQDHEMQAIADWLTLVHLVTALAGEALLGLVYIVGVCWIIGSRRTLNMIHAILSIDLGWLDKSRAWSDCFYYGLLWFVLVCFGLVIGTYLLFYSWIWAVGFHFMCRRILNVRKSIG
ncbi:hypothetical protein BC941DRAFT_413280 [Chlamydoabsidia padenii]|nr:hypothetical protein BC941DRAFT_413280 [Chlamydoabsidia padenii]